MSDYSSHIDPIRAQSALDPDLAVMLQGESGWSQDDWKDVPLPIIGWRLTLMHCGQTVEHQDFAGGDDGFRDAQAAGKAWLANHGADGISRWVVGVGEAMRRMSYDPAFRYQISKRGY